MLYNKNNVRKTNDKKILHKVGKQWKVVSVALLMAIGGAAAASHTNVHAYSTNDQSNTQTNSAVNYLNGSAAANVPRINAPQSVQSSNNSAKPSLGISYYPGSNGSAASYFDKSQKESNDANNYFGTVNSYVNSLNAEYGPQVHSYATKSASASAGAKNDSKLANSYSVENKNPNTAKAINSLANKNHMDPNLYLGMVQDAEQTYSNAVNSASNDVKANSDVASLANLLEGANLSAASLSASGAAVTAHSNFIGAQAISESVSARYKDTGKGAGAMIGIANDLSEGAKTLEAEGNPLGNDAQYSMLLNTNGYNGAQKSNASSAAISAVKSAVSSAKLVLSGYASEASSDTTNLSNYAGEPQNPGNFNSLVNTGVVNAAGIAAGVQQSEFGHAVSEATDIQFAPVLESVASSLYGVYSPEYANYQEFSAEYKSASSSASAALRAAGYAWGFASANSTITSSVSQDVSNAGTDGAAKVASNYLSEGVTNFAYHLGYYVHAGIRPAGTLSINGNVYGPDITTFGNNSTPDTFAGELASLVNNGTTSNHAIATSVLGATTDGTVIPTGSQGNQNSVASALNSDAAVLSTVASNASSVMSANAEKSGSASGKLLVTSSVAGNTYYELNETSTITSLEATLASSGDTTNSASAKALLEDNNLQFSAAGVNSVGGTTDGSYGTTGKTSVTTTQVSSQLTSIANVLSSMAVAADDVTATSNSDHTLKSGNGLKPVADNGFDVNNGYGFNGLDHDDEVNNDEGNYIKAALLSDGVDLDSLVAESGAISDVADAAKSASNSIGNTQSGAEKLGNELSAASSSANSELGSAQNASADYSQANDEDVTLSSYFASSYASDASDEANESTNESSALNYFLKSMADDNDFNTADDAYNNAEAAMNNDYKLGAANAKAVYNRSAHFLDVLKGAAIHTTPNFGANNDKVVANIKKGDRLTVYGVNVSRNNRVRGVIRYFVLDNANGKKGFITGLPEYTKSAYLSAVPEHQNVQVKVLKNTQAYSDFNRTKKIGTVKAGTVLNNADVVYGDVASQDAHGFTKVETQSGDFLTANTAFVQIVAPNFHQNNNQQPNHNYNLPNGQLNYDKYYNTDTQD